MAMQPSTPQSPLGTNRPASSFDPMRSTQMQPVDVVQDVTDYLKTYFREKPDVAALWCFGIGFVLGWKLKPW